MMFPDDFASWADERQDRPRTEGVLSPKLEIAVILNWMFNFVPECRPTEALSLFFGGEVCRT